MRVPYNKHWHQRSLGDVGVWLVGWNGMKSPLQAGCERTRSIKKVKSLKNKFGEQLHNTELHLIICSNCLLYPLVPTSKQAVSLAVFLRWRVVQQVRVYKSRSVQKNQQVQSIRFLKGSHPQWSVACFFHLSDWVFSSLKLAYFAQIDIGTHTETDSFLEVSTLEVEKEKTMLYSLYWCHQAWYGGLLMVT